MCVSVYWCFCLLWNSEKCSSASPFPHLYALWCLVISLWPGRSQQVWSQHVSLVKFYSWFCLSLCLAVCIFIGFHPSQCMSIAMHISLALSFLSLSLTLQKLFPFFLAHCFWGQMLRVSPSDRLGQGFESPVGCLVWCSAIIKQC